MKNFIGLTGGASERIALTQERIARRKRPHARAAGGGAVAMVHVVNKPTLADPSDKAVVVNR